jgi:transcriptional regulator with XRE-family HTH domain
MAGPKFRIAWHKFGNDVIAYRRAKRLGQRETARYLRISTAMMNRCENAKAIGPEFFLWICDWIGKDPKEYLAPIYTKAR